MTDATSRSVTPAGWPKPKGYSNGMVLPPGRPLFIAGMVGWDEREKIVGPGIVEQFRQALKNIRAVAEAAGSSTRCIGRLTIFVTDKGAYAAARREIGAAYREIFGDHYPAMALIEVKGLLETGAVVEIEAAGVVPSA